MMALDSARFVVRRFSGCLVLLFIAAAACWVSPCFASESDVPFGYADKSVVPFDLSVPPHFILASDQDNFRGGTLTWEPNPNAVNAVNLTLKVCWTRSDFPGGSDTDGFPCPGDIITNDLRSEEHTSELQSRFDLV